MAAQDLTPESCFRVVPPAGVYCSASSFSLTGNLNLTGSGVWIFKTVSTLIASPGSSVTGGDPCNVWWRIGSSVTLNTTTSFIGNILALNGANAMNTGATLNGRLLAQSAASVTLQQNTINGPICAPTITTALSATTIAEGDPVYDTATLVGASSNAGGTVTYNVYTENTCTTLYNGAGTPGTVTVTNDVVPNSNTITFPTGSAGTYFWQAVYSGNSNNLGASSACISEPLIVTSSAKGILTITTALSSNGNPVSSILVGSSVVDRATLHGDTAATAGGNVIYTYYTDSACTLNAQIAGTVTVTSGSVPPTDPITFPTAGPYYWRAVYSGDGSHNGATSLCTDEPLAVGKLSPTITTNLSDSIIPSGGAVHDGAPCMEPPALQVEQ